MSVIYGLPYLDAPSITCLPFLAFLPFSPSNYKRKETSISFQMFHMNIRALILQKAQQAKDMLIPILKKTLQLYA